MTEHRTYFAPWRVLAVLAAALAMLASIGKAEARTPHNTMMVEIDAGTSHMNEPLHLGLNKAAMVRLPADAADILVSNPDIVDAVIRTPRSTFLLAKQVGHTNAFFFDRDGRQILSLDIRVERDLEPLRAMLAEYLPAARIEASAINDNVVLKGRVPNAATASQARDIAARFVGNPDSILSMLAIEGGEQVLLKVRVAEMQRSVAKQFGIDLNAAFDIGSVDFSLATRNPFSVLGQFLTEEEARNVVSWNNNGEGAESIVRALERNGLVRTLAEPTLTAISGESANFLAGGEFPVPASRDRDGNVTVEFKPFGVGLGFTPVVLDEGLISLRISTEVSELTSEGSFLSRGGEIVVDGELVIIPGVTIPALSVRRAETTVELPSGGSLVMAGLLQEETKQNIDGYPGLKDTPVLGALFRSRDFQNNETELVVIVTPFLVNPVSATELVSPTDGYLPATDMETLLFGRLNGVYGSPAGATGSVASGGDPVGFILD